MKEINIIKIYYLNPKDDIVNTKNNMLREIKTEVCHSFGGKSNDPRLRVLIHTKRQDELFILWDSVYTGDIIISTHNDRIIAIFKAIKGD